MRKIVGIATGGMAGAVLRYWIRSMDLGGIPWDTLLVNIAGSFLLSFILTLGMGRAKLPADLQSGLTVGFLGAFTTFSAICQEYVTLFSCGQVMLAVLYMTTTIALGIVATYFGWRMARCLSPFDNVLPADEESKD